MHRVLVGRPEGKRPLGRPRRRWEDNIKMDLRDVGYDDKDWIDLAQDRDLWRAYVRAAMNLRTHPPSNGLQRGASITTTSPSNGAQRGARRKTAVPVTGPGCEHSTKQRGGPDGAVQPYIAEERRWKAGTEPSHRDITTTPEKATRRPPEKTTRRGSGKYEGGRINVCIYV
ncbi:hypothetical protein ANN_21072 [Periplaneta americana]|uniref:Uncharacterized protein n=1 Tax=Periplaneta americana TaxID=6978 RepID=A0ABQ8SEN5_PERAM|nr:hypothetical protein ANN_21072 [Periplaneta americana]